MTVMRQWLFVLVLSAILSVVINSVVLGALVNRFYIDYSTENYMEHISQVVEFSKNAIEDSNLSRRQIERQLETHLQDPITRIRLYDVDGTLLADVGRDFMPVGGMMGSRMMPFSRDNLNEEIDNMTVSGSSGEIGYLNVTRYSSIGESFKTRQFTFSLIANSIVSFVIVLAIILILGLFISRKMSKDLRNTAQLAVDIELGNKSNVTWSGVKEIRSIQQSLETLDARLKLKQKSRKKVIDEMVHQTRTPLTIVRAHLEGFEDGIITFDEDEVRTCIGQIETISSIISNMSDVIDTNEAVERTIIEPIEISHLMKQIVSGLRIQFERKQVTLELLSHQKITLMTDRNKLSQVIYNLLTNAYKYTNSNGKVTVEYNLDDREALRIKVKDTGTGISESESLKIFDAYYRGNNSKDIQGDGIGLYIVSENLRKIGGRVDVHSKLGEGSEFIITLPKYKEEPHV